MPAVLKGTVKPNASERVLERQALHELDDA